MIIFISFFLITPICGFYCSNLEKTNFLPKNSTSVNKNDKNYFVENTIDKINPSPYFVQTNYNPVLDVDGVGSDLSINDILSVYHPENLSISAGGSDIYNIAMITDYSTEELAYNMTINTQIENINYELLENKDDESLTTTRTMLAFKFTVNWEYGKLYGTRMFLKPKTGGYGADEVKIYLVKEGITGLPDLTVEYAHELNSPYNSSNPLPISSTGNFAYYDFNDTVLPSGSYFVVVEKTAEDGLDTTGFIWRSQQGSQHRLNSYYYDGTWHQNSARGLTFILQIQACNAIGNGIITDPADISLLDNGAPITSLTQVISSTGTHTLSADTSVDISLNNSYVFRKTILASTIFQSTNSSFQNYSVNWNASFQTTEVQFTPYTNPSRIQKIYLPSDWDKSSPNFLRGGSIPINVQLTTYGFLIDMKQFLSGGIYPDYKITFQSTSPNYLYNLSIDGESYNLGYWISNETHSTGYEGSSIDSLVTVKDSLTNEVSNGELNFTLFDPDGIINPIKSNFSSELIYDDTSNYSQIISTQSNLGEYTASTSFDPSVYGSDKEGYWIAFYLWQNGTEVGLITRRITVVKATIAEFEWEQEKDSGIWTSDELELIERIDGDDLKIRVHYYNISDTSIGENGTIITAANVTYSTEWLDSGIIPFTGSTYEYELNIDGPADTFTINMSAQGNFLQNHTIQFNIRILHEFQLSKEKNDYNTYYTNDFIIRYSLVDLSDLSNPIEPDVLTLQIVEFSEVIINYTKEFSKGKNIITFDSGDIPLNEGVYTLNLTVSKAYFVTSLGQNSIQVSFSLHILPIPTEISILENFEEINYNSQKTIQFQFFDTNHSFPIPDATVVVRADIENVEVFLDPEDNGVYTIVVKTLEPTVASLNIFIDVSKDGYEIVLNYRFPAITILFTEPTTPPEGLPIYIYVLIGILGAIVIILPAVLLARRKVIRERKAQKAQFTNIYRFYEGVLSITKLIIVHNATSLPVYEMDLGSEIHIDPSLITGFLSAVSTVGGEIKGDKSASVKRVEYRDFQVIASKSGQFTLYTFSEAELNKEIEKKLTVISDWFAMMFSNITEDWDGSTESFRMNLKGITEKIMKEIHLWIFYPFKVSPNKLVEIERLSGLSKKLVNYVKERANVTISRLFEDFDDIKLEQGLPIIFDLIEKNILEPEFDAYKIATVRF